MTAPRRKESCTKYAPASDGTGCPPHSSAAPGPLLASVDRMTRDWRLAAVARISPAPGHQPCQASDRPLRGRVPARTARGVSFGWAADHRFAPSPMEANSHRRRTDDASSDPVSGQATSRFSASTRRPDGVVSSSVMGPAPASWSPSHDERTLHQRTRRSHRSRGHRCQAKHHRAARVRCC